MKKITFLILLIAVAMSFCSCGVETCGDGKYKCLDMISTLPYQSPIKYIDYQDIFLFSNGDLVQKGPFTGQNRFVNLEQLCDCDTICDLSAQQLYPMVRQNQEKPVSTFNDVYLIVLAPTKAIGIGTFDIVERTFGNSGPDSTRLQDARYCAINSSNETFIADYGDSSIKVYDFDGNLIGKWQFAGEPFQLKCQGQLLYFLDKYDSSIKSYDKTGQLVGLVSLSGYSENVTAFTIINNEDSENGHLFWIADHGGTRLVGCGDRGQIVESKTDYCYQDISFTFGKIIGLSGFNYSVAASIYVVDSDNNMIIRLGYLAPRA
jgi:hypothetical protein